MTIRSRTAEVQFANINTSLLMVILILVDSMHFVFARLLLPYISPGVSAMYVLGIGTVEVGVYGLLTRRLRLAVLRHHWLFFVVVGLLVAASTNINYEAVAFIDAGTATLLGKTGIVFGLCLSLFWLKERLTRQQLIGAAIAIVGAFIIAFQPGDYLRFGSVLVLASTLMYALHTAVVKRYGDDIDFLNFFFFRLLATTAFLFLISVSRHSLEAPSAVAWVFLVLVGTVDVVISRTLFYVTLRQLTMSLLTIILTLSPVSAVLWSLLLFRTFPTPQQLLGGAFVLTGVVMAMRSSPQPSAVRPILRDDARREP
jgi:drug/metabolite transporter (DMT)-like permease